MLSERGGIPEHFTPRNCDPPHTVYSLNTMSFFVLEYSCYILPFKRLGSRHGLLDLPYSLITEGRMLIKVLTKLKVASTGSFSLSVASSDGYFGRG